MPGVANSTMKLPIFGPGVRASSFNPIGPSSQEETARLYPGHTD